MSLMQSNESLALDSLHKFKTVLENEVPGHNGQIINFYGDGYLAVFGSSVEAATCSQELQRSFGGKTTDSGSNWVACR